MSYIPESSGITAHKVYNSQASFALYCRVKKWDMSTVLHTYTYTYTWTLHDHAGYAATIALALIIAPCQAFRPLDT